MEIDFENFDFNKALVNWIKISKECAFGVEIYFITLIINKIIINYIKNII